MKLFVPTEDPAGDGRTRQELLVPYQVDYPCVRHFATQEHGEPRLQTQTREVRHVRS